MARHRGAELDAIHLGLSVLDVHRAEFVLDVAYRQGRLTAAMYQARCRALGLTVPWFPAQRAARTAELYGWHLPAHFALAQP